MKRRTYLYAALGLGTGGYIYTRTDGDENDDTDEEGVGSAESNGTEYKGNEASENGTANEGAKTDASEDESNGANPAGENSTPEANESTEEVERRSPGEAAEEEGLEATETNESGGNSTDGGGDGDGDGDEDSEDYRDGSGETVSDDALDTETEWRHNSDGSLDVGWNITNVSDATVPIVYVTFSVIGEDGSRLYEDSDGYRGLKAGETWNDFYRVAPGDLSGTPAEVEVEVSAENV